MSARLATRRLCRLFVALALVGQSLTTVARTVTTAGHTFVVNSTADLPDGNATDSICLALNAKMHPARGDYAG